MNNAARSPDDLLDPAQNQVEASFETGQPRRLVNDSAIAAEVIRLRVLDAREVTGTSASPCAPGETFRLWPSKL